MALVERLDVVGGEKVVVVAHHDVHGITSGYLASKAFSAVEVYANFPQTAPENLIQTLQNMYAASPQKLKIVIVDIPVNLKDPISFVTGLENIATRHEVVFIDHHESSVSYLTQFRRVKPIFLGPSALTLNNFLLQQITNANEIDKTIALLGAIGDRDPEVVKQGLLTNELQTLSDGLDVLVREKDGALRIIRSMVQNPTAVLDEAKVKANQIPSAEVSQRIGPVAVSLVQLPPQWGPKALEKMAFSIGSWYAVGWGIDERSKQPIARAIIRWDIQARMPNLPTPGQIARQLWPTRNIIGHPSAPSVATSSEAEAQEMTMQWARALADASKFSTKTTTFINESLVGEVFVEVLQHLEQILQNQLKMYQDYLELKKRQVELLERSDSSARRYD
jgi:hypothetical protein